MKTWWDDSYDCNVGMEGYNYLGRTGRGSEQLEGLELHMGMEEMTESL